MEQIRISTVYCTYESEWQFWEGLMMGQKVMLEATQAVVSGNEVVVHSGDLFEPGAKLPEGVAVRPVFVDDTDESAESPPMITRVVTDAPVRAPQKPPAKTPAK